MPRVFICYRREDTAGHAGRLFDRLHRSFGDDVFQDVERIEGGIDFQDHIHEKLNACDVLLAVIGPKWLQTRLDDPSDLLRAEIKAALDRKIRVIPVLVDNARLPAAELPEDLAPLARRQAVELRSSHWGRDVEEVIEVLKRIPRGGTPPPQPDPSPVPKPPVFGWVAGLAVVLAVVALFVVFRPRNGPDSMSDTLKPDASGSETHKSAVPLSVPTPTSTSPSTTTSALPSSTTSTPNTTASPPPVLSCVERWSQPSAAGVACAGGEILAAGGCTCAGGAVRSSYPSPEGQDVPATAWQCDGQCQTGLKAVALCCTVAP